MSKCPARFPSQSMRCYLDLKLFRRRVWWVPRVASEGGADVGRVRALAGSDFPLARLEGGFAFYLVSETAGLERVRPCTQLPSPGVYSSLSDSLALSLLCLSLSPRGEAWRGRAQGLSLGWADPLPAPDCSVLWASNTEPWCDRWGMRHLGPGAPADSVCDRPWSTPSPLEDPLYAWHPNQARLGPAHLELKARPGRCSIQVLHTLAAYN